MFELKDNKLIITLPLGTPTASKSGKTLVLATTNGFVKTSLTVAGKPLSVSVNAVIPR